MFNRNKLNKIVHLRSQEDIDAAKKRKAIRKITKNRKSAEEFLKAAGIMTKEGKLSSNYIA